MAVPLAHVIFVLDDSGSMSFYTEETKRAFDAFVSTLQKVKGSQIVLTLIKYGDSCEVVYKAKPIQDVGKLEYNPKSSYDIPYDAVHFAAEIAEAEKRSNKVVICLLCDGGDNASKHTRGEARKLIERKLKEGWEFCFLAAGDRGYIYCPAEVAKRIGIPENCIIKYAQGHDGGKAIEAFGASAWNIGSYAAGRAEHVSYTADQKKKVGG